MRRTPPRRPLRACVLVLVVTLVLAASTSCRPPRNGVAIAKRIAWMQLNARGWTPQAGCLVDLWQAESGWNVFALNKSSGAYGIPQALPARRLASAGRDWITNPATQIRWGLDYIAQRYGGPCNAWRHERQVHWYIEVAPPASPPPASPSPASPSPAAPAAPGSQSSPAPASRSELSDG